MSYFPLSTNPRRRLLLWLFGVVCFTPLNAGIFILSQPRDLTPDQTVALGAMLEVHLDGFELLDVSTEHPRYLRLRLPTPMRLQETLVGAGQEPINLAVSLIVPIAGTERVIAPPTSVQLVRWRAGEDTIWVRFDTAFDQWVTGLDDPNGSIPIVAFSLGLTLGQSLEYNLPAYQNQWANLPYNTRLLQSGPDLRDESPTPLQIDLNGVQTMPGHALDLNVDLVENAFGVENVEDPREIDPGQIVQGTEIGPVPLFFVVSEPPDQQEPLLLEAEATSIGKNAACAPAGSATLSFNSIAIPSADIESPLYFQLELASGARLCETRVDPLNGGAPINLAIGLSEDTARWAMEAPADAIQIVRWRAGERAVWLRIQSTPMQWLFPIGEPDRPYEEVRFFVQVGVDAATSQERMAPLFAANRANLPGNRDSGGNPVDTDLGVDIRDATLSSLAPRLFLEARNWLGSSNITTSPDEARIDPGVFLGFSAADVVAELAGSDPTGSRGLLLTSLIQTVNPTGRCEETGNLTMEINDDLYSEATPVQPLYMRLELDNEALLCETRVNQGADPIYLALRLRGNRDGLQLVAPPDTAAIVRWIAGEKAIWLRFSQPSNTWLQNQAGDALAPTPERPVTWSIGISAETSSGQNVADFQAGWSNLPANTRESQGAHTPVDTKLTVDLSNAVMDSDQINWNGLLAAAPQAFLEADGVEDGEVVDPGEPLFMRVLGKAEVAQGALATVAPVTVQGVEPAVITARIAKDITPTAFRWEDMESGQIISLSGRIIWDPIPPADRHFRLTVTDRHGRATSVEGRLLVNPEGHDLNGDGVNDREDLNQALPGWPAQRSVLNLLRIRLD